MMNSRFELAEPYCTMRPGLALDCGQPTLLSSQSIDGDTSETSPLTLFGVEVVVIVSRVA